MGVLEQALRELDRAADAELREGAGNVGEHVEGAGGTRAGDTFEGVEPGVDVFGAGLKFLSHLFDTGLVAVQGGDKSVLSEGEGAAGGLGLDLGHALDDVGRAGGVADPPAGHGVGLGASVEGDGVVVGVGGGGGVALEGVVAEDDAVIHLVAEDDNILALEHGGQGVDLGGGVEETAWVTGRIEDEGFGPRSDGRFQLGGSDLKGVVNIAEHVHRHAAAERGLLGVGDPVGGGDDDFVAFVEQGGEGEVEGLFAADGDDDLGGGVVERVFAGELGGNCLFERDDAGGGGGVLGGAAVQGVDGGLLDVIGGVEVGLAGAEADDVFALAAQLGGAPADGHGGRFGQVQDSLRQFHFEAFPGGSAGRALLPCDRRKWEALYCASEPGRPANPPVCLPGRVRPRYEATSQQSRTGRPDANDVYRSDRPSRGGQQGGASGGLS